MSPLPNPAPMWPMPPPPMPPLKPPPKAKKGGYYKYRGNFMTALQHLNQQ